MVPAAERRANSPLWRLVLSFRAVGDSARSFWIPFPLESPSKARLFAQAERIPDDRLTALLAERLG
ncbi:MAG TPA: hypothetical protein VK012_03675 [Gemmatimonadales bacterium]|nr:hypothetical protein [Gemmatimonadales bacterium]